MRIAVLSDIHGNAFALEAVMNQIKHLQIDRVFFLGDLMGYYYHPKMVYQKLQELNATMILGNHEHFFFDCLDEKISIEQLKIRYGSGHKMALEQFSSSEITELRGLPDQHQETIHGVTLSFYHGSPFDKDFYLYPDTDAKVLQKCDTGVEFTFVGHSHYPFISQLPNGLLVNVGSVGQSRIMGGIANWCILNLNNRVIEMQSTAYNINPLLDLINQYDQDISYLSRILKRGINEE
jgi:putative phosphoesterase